MQRMKVIGMTLMAVLVVGVMVAVPAYAAPEFLPGTAGTKFASSKLNSAEAVFHVAGIATTIKCKKAPLGPGGGELTNKKLGTVDLLLLECKSSALPTCTGLTDTTAGSILVTGTWHIRGLLPKGSGVVQILLLNELHFECGTVLVTVRGCAVAKIEPVGVKTMKFTLNYKKGAGEESEWHAVDTESGEGMEECVMQAEVNGSAFATAWEVAEGEVVSAAEETLDE
jgi:hypothetical protein